MEVLRLPQPRQARSVYRGLWSQFLLTPDAHHRSVYATHLDAMQPLCASLGEPTAQVIEFKQFTEALPGYVSYWTAWQAAHRRSVR